MATTGVTGGYSKQPHEPRGSVRAGVRQRVTKLIRSFRHDASAAGCLGACYGEVTR